MTVRKKGIFIAIAFFWFLNVETVVAQNGIVKGIITESTTKDPISFVNVGIKDQHKGTTGDISGKYELMLSPGKYVIIFSCVGYLKYQDSVIVKAGKTVELNVSMKPSIQDLDITIVTASKFEQKLEYATNSIDILKPSMLEDKNILSLDKAIESVPGVAIVDNEPQIRAGSGFSSGLGSRVMILVDEIPMMRVDAGRPVWSFLPVEDVEQIEVVKGASSVIFGSSALNGAINIRTAYPKEKPLTKVTIHSGIYNTPRRSYTKSWNGFNPVIVGASFIHSKQVNNFDYVIGGNFLSDPGVIGGPPNDTTGDYKNGEYEKNFRLNFGTRIRSNVVEGLTYGMNGNFMISRNAQAFFWNDADSNIYRAYPGALTNFSDFQFYLDPYVKYYGNKGAIHSFKNRFYYSQNNASNNQSSMSYFLYDEYQFSKKFKKLKDLTISTGVMNMYGYSYGKVFSGKFNEPGSKSSDNFAVYCQLEKRFFTWLTLSGGARYEYYKIGDYTDGKPIFRAGVNIKATKVTYLRASFGQGFRFPSIGERYISTFAGNFGIYPNPDLQSETSWNTEIGIKQLFKIKDFVGFIDVCGFWQQYQNYIEFNAGLWGRNLDSLGHLDITKNLGYKFLNTADARVIGLDIAIMGEGKLAKNFKIGILGGYTFSRPTSLEPHKIYFTDTTLTTVFNYANTSSDTTNNILKYRFEHLAKLDIEFTYKRVTLGLSGKYYGYMRNIDNFFVDNDRPGMFNTGINNYRKENNKGAAVFDARISYEMKKHFKFSFLVNNILNTEYSLRPIYVEPPRVTSLQIVYKV
jgi:iron complex outermembrane receptor protein